MRIVPENIYNSPGKSDAQEIIEVIADMDDARIERITTLKPYTGPGEWYDQQKDEWVILLSGNAEIEIKGQGTIELFSGDYIFLPAHCHHRVTRTSTDPPSVWLAIHGRLK